MHTDFKDTLSGEKEVGHFDVAVDISPSFIRRNNVGNEPVDDIMFMEIFESLEQLLHKTFYYKPQELALSE